MAKCVISLALFAITSALLMGSVLSDELLPYEPVQYLKAHLPSSQTTPFTELIGEATPTEAAEFSKAAKRLLKSHLGSSETSVVLLKGERVLVQQRAKKLQWDTKLQLPYCNALSLMSIVMPILLEGYKGSMIKDSIGKVLKGTARNHPLVTGRESLSFLDLITKFTSSRKAVKLDSASLLNGLKANGELSFHFVNAVLGGEAPEAWKDALMALDADAGITREETGELTIDISSLVQLSLSVAHDMKAIGAASKKDKMALDDDKYLFGWWFNCAKDSSSPCLIPNAPKDTIFSLSPDLRLYITPSLELTLIVLGPGITKDQASGKTVESVADILIADNEIWKQFALSVSDASEQSQSGDRKDEVKDTKAADASTPREAAKEAVSGSEEASDSAEGIHDANIIAFIHWIWPMLGFLFWVTFSHIWVYWLLHGFWFFMTSVSSRAYAPRPKTPAEAGN